MSVAVMCEKHPEEASWTIEGDGVEALSALFFQVITHLATHGSPDTKKFNTIDLDYFARQLADMIYHSETYNGEIAATIGIPILSETCVLYRYSDTKQPLFSKAIKVQV